MAIYRQIYMSFWTDPKVDDDFTPEDKYFYLYLLTNPHTNICGCYEISLKQMERETGYNTDTVKRLIRRMVTEHNVIRYEPSTKEVLLLNWHKYNWTASADLRKNIRKSAADIKSSTFQLYITSLIDHGDTVLPPSQEGGGTSVTVTVTDTVTVSDAVNNKSIEKFEEWWKEYPKKVGKQDAKKSYAKALKLPGVTAELLLTAVQEQKKSDQWAKDNGQYIPNPATWLNQGRWDDELERRGTNGRTDKSGRAADSRWNIHYTNE